MIKINIKSQMLTLSVSLALAAFALTSCGGKDDHESLARQSITLMSETVDVLDGVTDKASAEAAKPKLEAIVVKIEDIKKRMTALGEPDEATQEKLKKVLESEGKKITTMMMTLMKRFMTNPEILGVLQETMGKMK